MGVLEQQSSCPAPQIFPDQGLPNYTLTTYIDGLVFPQRSSAIETRDSHLISEKWSQGNSGSNRTYPLHSTLKPMDSPNERTNGWSNISVPSLPHTQKIGPTGSLSHQQCTTIELTQPPDYRPMKSFLATLHASPHQKWSEQTTRQWRNEWNEWLKHKIKPPESSTRKLERLHHPNLPSEIRYG